MNLRAQFPDLSDADVSRIESAAAALEEAVLSSEAGPVSVECIAQTRDRLNACLAEVFGEEWLDIDAFEALYRRARALDAPKPQPVGRPFPNRMGRGRLGESGGKITYINTR